MLVSSEAQPISVPSPRLPPPSVCSLSSSSSPTIGTCGKCDWNQRFQRLLALSAETAGREGSKAWELTASLRALCVEFAEAARQQALVIITERNLPQSQASFPALASSGIAGGTKHLAFSKPPGPADVGGVCGCCGKAGEERRKGKREVRKDRRGEEKEMKGESKSGGTDKKQPGMEKEKKKKKQSESGECRCASGIFYKFAVDAHGLYGSDGNAAKSANAELRGAMALLECRVAGLHLPLMALVHFRGMTLVAQAQLPIDRSTLLYGSQDARLHVVASDPVLNEKIRLAGRSLNLAPHLVRSRKQPMPVRKHSPSSASHSKKSPKKSSDQSSDQSSSSSSSSKTTITLRKSTDQLKKSNEQKKHKKAQKPKKHTISSPSSASASASSLGDLHLAFQEVLLYGPGDLEGHLGHDGKFYVIDTSRLFPPTAPRDEPRCYLYRFLRPEFVQRCPWPISSDAFSPWASPADRARHDEDARAATVRLESETVPAFARSLDTASISEAILHSPSLGGRTPAMPAAAPLLADRLSSLIQQLHFAGINIRYLFLVLTLVSSPVQKHLLATEIVARAFKNHVREQWRGVSEAHQLPYAALFVQHWKDTFSLGFPAQQPRVDDSSAVKLYFAQLWRVLEPAFIKVCAFRSAEWLEAEHSLELLRGHVVPPLLGERILQLTAVSLEADRDWVADAAALRAADVVCMSPIIKPMSRLSFDEGTALSRLATASDTSPQDADALLAQASLKYREALLIRPNDHRALLNWGLTLLERAKLEPDQPRRSRFCEEAAEKLKMVVQTHPRNHLLKARVYHQWGSSLLEVVSRGSSAGTTPTTPATASGSMAVTSSPSFPLMRNESVDLSRETDSKKQQRKFEVSTLIIASRLLDSAAGAVRDNKGVGGEQLDEFSVCYNAGTAYLRLAGFSSSISLAPASKHDIPRSSARKYLQRAVSFFERASLADPSRLHALRNLAVAYARLGRTFDDDSVTQCQLFDAAISTHDKVLLLDPLNPESLFDAANCLFRFAGALSARLSPDTPSSTLSSPIFTSSGYDVLSLYRRAVSGYAQAIQQYQRAPGGSPASLPRSAFINLGLSLSAFLKALLRSPASLADPSLPSMLDAVVTEYLGFVDKQPVEWSHRFVPPVLTVLLKLDPALLSSALSRQVLQQLSQFESRSTMLPGDSPPLVNSGGHPIGPDPAVVELTLSPCPSEPPSEPGFIFQEASLRAHGISELAVFRSLGQFASSKSCAFPRFLVQLAATAPERKPLHFLLQTVPRSALATQQWQGGSRSLLSVESRAYLLPVCLIYQNPMSLFVFFRAEAPLYGMLRSGTASSLFSDVKQTLAELLYAIMALAEAEGWV
ncbi:MAG: hypothetical protein Q8P67_25745, partial [archaeon]|nr:hypothetical protein [archaeon]